jgi:Uma2 family endonuclease
MGAIAMLREVVGVLPNVYPHEVTKSNLIQVLNTWSLHRSEFRVFCETAFQLNERDPLLLDVSMIASSRLIPGTAGLFQGVPDLAIEVVSSELETALRSKISLYFSNGGKSFWVVYPEARRVHIEDATGVSVRFSQDQPLTDPILPGFSIPTSAIFEGV